MLDNKLEEIKKETETFGLESLRIHLRAITKSKNYEVTKDEKYPDISLNFKTKKYLYPIDVEYGRDYTTLFHFSSYNKNEFKEALYTLVLCKELKALKEANMPLHEFIREVSSWVSMCISLLAYGSKGEQYFQSRRTYNLPENTKREIYNYVKSQVKGVNYGVYEDGEGCSYNSIELK